MRYRAALLILLAGSLQVPQARGEGAVAALVSRLRAACETRPELHGAWVRDGTLAGGTLELVGSLDDPATQARLLAEEGARLLKEEPAWRAEVPGGVSAGKMAVFPVRSVILRRLQERLAESAPEKDGRPGLLGQTRLDDLYFDQHGRLQVVGLCVNQRAFVSRRNPGVDGGADPPGEIAVGLLDRLRDEAVPEGVDPQVFARLRTDGVRFAEDPARPLQRAAGSNRLTDECLFLHGRFDRSGRLALAGYVPTAAAAPGAAREAVKNLLKAPEFVKTYRRPPEAPGAADPDDPERIFTGFQAYDWREALLSYVRSRCARGPDPARGSGYRHCRVDRALFNYGPSGGLVLRFEGVSLDDGESRTISGDLYGWCRERFRFGRAVDYDIELDFKSPGEPLESLVDGLRRKVAEAPELDGVRVDDLTFGPNGEAEVAGVWDSDAQAEPLVALATPALADGIGGATASYPVVPRMTPLPTSRLLGELRGLVARDLSLDETSLDRLLFAVPGRSGPGAVPVLTLQVTTVAALRPKVEAALGKALRNSDPARTPGMMPTLAFLADRRSSVLESLWKLVSDDPTLDGVRVDRVTFDETNTPRLICVQESDGQLSAGPSRDKLLRKYAQAAATAWPGLPAPAAEVVPAHTYSLKGLIRLLGDKLPNFREADGVMLTRAQWGSNRSVVFHGRRSQKVDEAALGKVIKGVLANGSLKTEFSLDEIPGDPVRNRLRLNAVFQNLRAGRLAATDLEVLDEAIFFEPRNSTAWYMRSAYYLLGANNPTMAYRDMERTLRIEAEDPSGGAADRRRRAIANFKGPARKLLDDNELRVERARLKR